MALTGFAYPLELDEFGQLKTVSDADYVQDLIRSYVETELGERLGLETTYGIPDYTFRAYQTFGFAGKDIEKKLTNSIPQAEFSVRSIINDIGEAQINIFWSYNGLEQENIIFLLETGVNNG